MGSNGLTSARHDVFNKILASKYSESFDPSVPDELVYSGTKNLTDKINGTSLDAGKLVLSQLVHMLQLLRKYWRK